MDDEKRGVIRGAPPPLGQGMLVAVQKGSNPDSNNSIPSGALIGISMARWQTGVVKHQSMKAKGDMRIGTTITSNS
jgi:hypothetical protein